MSINNSKIGNKKYKQGKYILKNVEKYIGDPTNITYRSSWEFFFSRWLDLNEKVKKWSAENIVIQYQIINNLNQVENHRYYPDFYLEMVNNTDLEKYDRIIIEIKPKHETEVPVPPKRQTLKMLENYEYALKTYKKNLYKWSYAKEWCEKRNIKFVIITEDDLKKRGII